ncbi:MAG: response regulator [Acidobacteriota bacterium]
MESWDAQIASLREQFLQGAPERISQLRRSLDLLAANPADQDALRDLQLGFHKLAGLGTTFGFPEVTEAGQAGEAEAGRLIQAALLPDARQIGGWGQLVDRLEEVLFRTAPAAAPAAADSPVAESRREQPYKIVVVEDDAEFASALGTVLEQRGMTVALAKGAAEARGLLERDLPDAVVTDIRLGDGSGFELVRWFRLQPGGESPAVLVVSVLSDFLDRVEAVHCGADAYFAKPVRWEELVKRLEGFLEDRRTQPPRILSVEDDPLEGRLLAAIFESAGYRFRLCSDPGRLEAELAAFRPDLLLMDVLLPGLSGFSLVRYLRQSEAFATLPVIFLTTQGQLRDQIQALRAGGDAYLTKPVNPSLLLASVASQLEKARQLSRLVDHDGLTGLLTHSAFFDRAAAVYSRRARPRGRGVVLAMLDLDHFKEINDRWGHLAGDRVLVALAGLLRQRLRQSDVIGRYGGEEFALILEDLTGEEALRLVRRLLGEFSATAVSIPGGGSVRASFSAGLALLAPSLAGVDAWIEAADEALYAAKVQGRQRVVLVKGTP